ncbi:MAG: hypothetical protein CVU90_12560 [Firmicutes bacterium HGW-Firmicutes-15]|nr:MAG: hypothetical protein CVU90_12560 [Firmicutes bacterium HGW-Firmicutes-15]
MTQSELRLEKCLSCPDLGYCMVRWGPECKRQGGTKIPRMKTTTAETRQEADKQPVSKKTMISMFEPIRTRVANW